MLKIVEKLNSPLRLYMDRRISLFKNEDLGYVGAFLACLRTKLLPLHSRNLNNFPSKNEIDGMMKEIYEEMKDLYIDEHWTLANADYLEQCFEMFSSLHKITRKYELVYNMKLEENRKQFLESNPNDFPFHNLSGDFGDDFRSIWDLDKSFNENLEKMIGHTLKINDSKIEHQDAGSGVFISCKKRKFILPGTLLGFYPGVINYHFYPKPVLDIKTTYPYLERYDGVWIDPYQRVPYPIRPFISLAEWEDEEKHTLRNRGISDFMYNLVPIHLLNPYALGHMINHPPPNIAANVKFIDIEIPFTFYPTDFQRYIPYLFSTQEIKKLKFHGKCIRGVGIIAVESIEDGEELYEKLTPVDYLPDWLLQPPPRNPYLIKNDYTMVSNVLDNFLYKLYMLVEGENRIDFHRFITREEGNDVIEAREHIKLLQQELEKTKLLTHGNEEIKKLN